MGENIMSLHASMSAIAIRRRIERDQTTHYIPTIAEEIAARYETALIMEKQIGYPPMQKKGAIRVPELEKQLALLADYAAEAEECFADDPPTMRIYNADERLLEEIARTSEWLVSVELPHYHTPVTVTSSARWFRHGGTHPLSIDGAAYCWCTTCGEILSLDNELARKAWAERYGVG
jgi:hypothetical protein